MAKYYSVKLTSKYVDNFVSGSFLIKQKDPKSIVEQIEVGIKKTKGKYEVIIDRKEAIEKAIKMANKSDIIVLAGKGHEPYQEINGEKFDFDERKIVKEIIG